VFVIPAVLFFVTRRWCRALQAAEAVEGIHEEMEETLRARAPAGGG
jgi:hypothetical protein